MNKEEKETMQQNLHAVLEKCKEMNEDTFPKEDLDKYFAITEKFIRTWIAEEPIGPELCHVGGLSSDRNGGHVQGSGDYPKYSKVMLGAEPNRGYHFVKWKEDGCKLRYRMAIPLEDITLTAVFEKDEPETNEPRYAEASKAISEKLNVFAEAEKNFIKTDMDGLDSGHPNNAMFNLLKEMKKHKGRMSMGQINYVFNFLNKELEETRHAIQYVNQFMESQRKTISDLTEIIHHREEIIKHLMYLGSLDKNPEWDYKGDENHMRECLKKDNKTLADTKTTLKDNEERTKKYGILISIIKVGISSMTSTR